MDTSISQVQQKLNNLQEEERSVTAQLSWKRALEDSSPVMVNGSAGSTSEQHQEDPFQEDLYQEDQFTELKEEPAVGSSEHKELPEQKEKGAHERPEEEEREDESSKTPDEQQIKPDALDDLYTSLASSEIYNNVSAPTKPRENKVINNFA